MRKIAAKNGYVRLFSEARSTTPKAFLPRVDGKAWASPADVRDVLNRVTIVRQDTSSRKFQNTTVFRSKLAAMEQQRMENLPSATRTIARDINGNVISRPLAVAYRNGSLNLDNVNVGRLEKTLVDTGLPLDLIDND